MRTRSANPAPEWTIRSLLEWTRAYFDSHAIDSPRAAGEILLAHALGLRRIDLYLRYDQPLNPDELQRYKALVIRRVKREPVAYIVGAREFWSMELHVTPDVLIPRPETECLVEAALTRLQAAGETGVRSVLELGTGSGAVVLALASQCPGHRYVASDRSPRAAAVALGNARRHALGDCVAFVCGDWFTPLAPRRALFDLIVSNPPYVSSADIGRLQPEIQRYEPVEALDGGPDGLGPIRRLVAEAPEYLKPGGWLLLEIGCDQQAAVVRIAGRCGRYEAISVGRDYAGRPRVASMRCT